MIRTLLMTLGLCVASTLSLADTGNFVAYPAGSIALRDVTLIDGSGEPARTGQTVLLNMGRITAVGNTGSLALPIDVRIIEGRGRTLLPGFVLLHEHMFYPTGKRNYTEMLYSFPKLYLAGGVTTLRTAGTTAPYADLKLRAAIASGENIGPTMDVTAPHMDGKGLPILKIPELEGVDATERMVTYWADEGVTSYKGYMHLTREELRRIIDVAHKRRLKVTAHLCSITYREAARLGIDNLEHGFVTASDFVPDKEVDQCPAGDAVLRSIAGLDLESEAVRSLIDELVERDVAITSTLTVFETFTPGRPQAWPEALDLLIPQLRSLYLENWQAVADENNQDWVKALANTMALEKMFVEAGGHLLVGTDPTGYGGVIAGYSSLRAFELLLETGFGLEQSVFLLTQSGARFLQREDQIGRIAAGFEADLVLVDGDLLQDPSAIRRLALVFSDGVAYDSGRITAAMKDTVGLY